MDKERYVNQSRLAEIRNVSRQAIRKAVNENRLILHGAGREARVDLECPMTVLYLNGIEIKPSKKKPPRDKPKKKASPAKDKKATPPPAPEQAPVTLAPDDVTRASDEEEKLSAFNDKQEIEKLKKIEEIEKLKLHNREKRNELIERTIIEQYMNGQYEIDNGQWKPLGLKISSNVAAVFGIDDDEKIREACGLIDKEVFNILKLVKREQNKLLKKIGAKKLPKKASA